MPDNLTTTGLIIAGGQQALIAAKEFATKLLSPAIEEVGLILKDEIAVYRFKNQIKLLTKTKAICESNGISPKAISPKLLLPLLDYASLEDDEIIQEKWAILLSNLADSDQNIDNHVLPHLLSQISRSEYLFLENVINSYQWSLYERNEIQSVPIGSLRDITNIEKSNLTRLGLIEQLYRMYEDHNIGRPYGIVNASESKLKHEFQITAIGVLFVKACTEKRTSV